jgi:hypothetical protein
MPYAEEASPYAQAYHAHDLYLGGAVALPSDIQTDLDARITAANATHGAYANADLANGLNYTQVSLPHLDARVYTGGNRVTVAANRAGVDSLPEDAQGTEDLEMEVLVKDALEADELFARGGFVGATEGSYYHGQYSAYVDSLWLVEAAKQTGEKFY